MGSIQEATDSLKKAVQGSERLKLDAGTLATYEVDGLRPQAVVKPLNKEELSAVLSSAHAHQLGVIPWGGGTMMTAGQAPSSYDLAIDLKSMDHIVDYPAEDLTITVEAGITLAALNEKLHQNRQFLPFDPPFPEKATIGGLIASGASGPMRLGFGGIKDSLLGLQMVLSDGTIAKSGSRVVKNVAGYDLGKLFTGSWGTLGVITSASFKVRPLPEKIVVVSLACGTWEVAVDFFKSCRESAMDPCGLELLNPAAAPEIAGALPKEITLVVGLAGFQEDVTWQLELLAGIQKKSKAANLKIWEGDSQKTLMASLRDFPGKFSGETKDQVTFKANLLPSEIIGFSRIIEQQSASAGLRQVLLLHLGLGTLCGRFYFNQGKGVEAETELLLQLQERAFASGGNLVVQSGPGSLKQRIPGWGKARGDFELMRQIKDKIDPKHLLNPGRFIG